MGDQSEDRTSQYQKQRRLNNLLLLGCVRGHVEDVSGLVEMGAEWDCKDKAGISTLHFAAAHGRLEVVKWLWSKGAELDWEDKEGRTPLHVASAGGYTDVVVFLVENGSWLEGFDSKDDTPLHMAARAGHLETVEQLLEHGGKVKALNRRGLTALGEALTAGHVEVAKKLLEYGGDLNAKPRGYSLAHLVSGLGQAKALQFLIDKKINIQDSSNNEGLTPLHSACMASSPACVEALLKAGADPSAVDAAGIVPGSYVEGDSEDDKRVLQVLENWAAKPRPKKKSQPAAAPATPASTGHAKKPRSLKDAFRDLSPDERYQRIHRWCDKGELDLAVLMKDFTQEARKHAAEANKIKRLITLQQALECIHDDELFQSDLRRAGVRKAIDAIRAKPETYEQYNKDPAVANVMLKLRRYHALAKENGFASVNLDDLVVPEKADHKKVDTQQRQKLRSMLQQQIRAAAAAAAEDTEETAKKAAQAALVTITEIEPEEAQTSVSQNSHAREGQTPWKQRQRDPQNLREFFQLYFEELRMMTYNNQAFWDALIQRCVMAVILSVIGLSLAFFVRWMFPDMPTWFQRIGPGGPHPGMGLLQEMMEGKFGAGGRPQGGPHLPHEDPLPVVNNVEL